ncbi:MAG: C4-type zinc ribbon domain-containing protein [Calditrichia bacterium]
MKEVVKNLMALQRIDSRFDELQLQKGDLPMIIEEAEESLQEKKSKKVELEEKIKKGDADRRMFQHEIEASKEKLAKYEEQLYTVQTNKEYDAISLEIDTKKMEINELENKILQSLEEEEETTKIIQQLEQEISEIEKQLTEYRAELEEIIKQTQAEEDKLKEEQKGIIQNIDKRLMHQYQRIRKAKGGLAVASIRRGSCGGCYSAIPPQKIVEIRELNRLYTCENCGRILVWDEDLNED